ncbi:hypothetical protein [Vibrio crassostreae]|uniref:hypothetical protein n=1 Tax=Vibrio crassostreae TaxID=246167 RepID=UPI001B301D0C|nr:hypothetical protein [Vibrio crassostreae]
MINAAHRAVRTVTERFVEAINKEMASCNCRIKPKTIGTSKSVFSLVEGCNHNKGKPTFTRFHKIKLNTMAEALFKDVIITYNRNNNEVTVNII